MDAATLETAVYAFFVTAHGTLFDVLPAELSRKFDVIGDWRAPRLTFSLFPALLLLCAGVVVRSISPRDLVHSGLAIGIVSCVQASFYWDLQFIPGYVPYYTAAGMLITATVLATAPLITEMAARGGKAIILIIGSFNASYFTLTAVALVLFNPIFFTSWISSVRAISSGHISPVPEFSSDLGAAVVLSAILILVPASMSVFAAAVPRRIQLTLLRLSMLVMVGLSLWFFHTAYLSFKHL